MNELGKLASQAMISPKEMLFEKKKNAKSLFIGIPKEISLQEKRICLTPLAVALLVENGHEVIIETGAGAGANFLDHHYSEQGARIVSSREEVYQADLIIKVGSPVISEVKLMKERQLLLSSQQPSLMNLDVLKALMHKKITAISYEYLRDEGGCLAVVRAMSEIVGATATLIAQILSSN